MYELEYLREIDKQHGHYLRQYFGFTLKEIANQIGINPKNFIMIVRGQRNLPEKHEKRFIEVFKEMRIEEKTMNFKESLGQLNNRRLRDLIRKHLTILILFSIILNMESVNSSFFLNLKDTCREYIKTRRQYSRLSALKFNLRPITLCVKQSVIGLFLFIYTAILSTSRSIFLSLNLQYE